MDDERGCAPENLRRRQGPLGESPRRGPTGQKETHLERGRPRENRRRRTGALGEGSRREEQIIHATRRRIEIEPPDFNGGIISQLFRCFISAVSAVAGL